MTHLLVDPADLLARLIAADEQGIVLETLGDVAMWHFFPSPLHQSVVQELFQGIRSDTARGGECECFTLTNAYVQLPDGSLRRPDLMAFCTRPHLTHEALKVVPEAVFEVMSPGGEMKDLQLGRANYLQNGVKDASVVDPETDVVHHFRRDGSRTLRRGD